MNFDNLTQNDWINLLYLSLLLIVVAGSVLFKSHLKASELLKQAFLWFIIILVIIIAYSFRYEFYDLKDRIATELFPTKAVKIGKGQIKINIANDGHYYVDLIINGKPIRFMVDTGASDIVLEEHNARRVGIDLSRLSYDQQYQTANGVTFGAAVILKEVRIADITFKDVYASVNNTNMGISLLGMSFLRRFKKYEFYQDSLILTY